MRTLKQLLAAPIVAIALAGPAQALTTGTTSNGSLFLAVWDSSAAGTFSYVQDLGATINSFLPNGNLPVSAADGGPATGDKSPAAGLALNWTTSFLGAYAGNPSNLRWNVAAYDNSAANLSFDTHRVTVTVQSGTNNAGGMTNSGLANVAAVIGSVSAQPGLDCASALGGCANGASAYLRDSYGDRVGSGTLLSTSQGLGASLQMLYLTQSGPNPYATIGAGYDFFDNPYSRATWNLSGNGLLVYQLTSAPAAVPVPAAAWLFGSGLLGLAGIARRRRGSKGSSAMAQKG